MTKTSTDITVAVGSRNPPKLKAVEDVFQGILGGRLRSVRVFGSDVESGVPEQPRNGQTFEGALNRCKAVARSIEAEFHVGIEAGINDQIDPPNQYCFEVAYVYSNGIFTPGVSSWFLVPPPIANLLAEVPMSDAADQVLGTTHLGRQEGLVGVITDNRIKRAEYIGQAVLLALCSHLKPYHPFI